MCFYRLMSMLPYVIRQGDYLSKLAHQFGFDATDVWNHSQNEALRCMREDPEVLAPGDVLFIPRARPPHRLAITNGTTNTFSANVPTTNVSLRLRDPAGNPIANKAYRVTGTPAEITGSSDGKGNVSFRVPVHLSEAHLAFEEGGSLRVYIGHMDPVQTASGALKRLQHLGYRAPLSIEPENALRLMVMRFQRDHGLTVNGDVDDPTRAALVSAHES